MMRVVTDSSGLEALCRELADGPFLVIDTEFLRDTTYWPKLCLIQVATPTVEAIIDPLAPGLQDGEQFKLEPLVALLRNPDLIKVFHAARQDMELFVHRLGVLPKPVYDTQIAAMVCGFGESVGYETLVKTVLGRSIDKSSRFTDWSRRPLTEKQLTYALADVTHLREIYPHLLGKLEESGRLGWVAEEIAELENPDLYTLHPEDAWRRLKFRNTSRRFLGVLRAVAAWRESEAQSRDVPRNRIIKDDALLEIAAHAPKDKSDIDRLRGVPRGFGNSATARALIEAVAKGQAVDGDDLPSFKKPAPPPPGTGPIMELLRVLLKKVCEDEGVAPKLIATSADLEKIAADDNADVRALTGWRRDLFGASAIDLKNGRLALATDGKSVVLVPTNLGS